MAYSSEVKSRVLKRIEEGEKIKNISEETGISIPTLYNWKKQMNNKEDRNEESMQEEKAASKKIKELIELEEYDKAAKIAERYPNNIIIQSQMVTIAIREEEYEKAKEIGARFEDNAPIQSQMVTIAIREEEYEKAKEIGARFEDNALIQSQMVTIAIREGDFQKIEEIGARFENYKFIQYQIKEFGKNSRLQQSDSNITQKEDIIEKNKEELGKLKTKIYYDKIDEKLIENINGSTNLTDYQKTVILLSICEKKKMAKRAKQIVKLYTTQNKEETTTINKILARIESKKVKIFDIGIYDRILGWEFEEELVKQYNAEIEKEKITKKKKEEEQMRKIEDESKRLKQESVKTKVEGRKKRLLIAIPSNVRQEKEEGRIEKSTQSAKMTINPKQRSKTNKMLSYIIQFIKDEKRNTYVNMQSKNAMVQSMAIKRWDKLEILLEKISENSENSNYIENLYNKIVSREKEEER